MQSRRSVPLILVASSAPGYAERIAVELRRDGNVVCIAHSPEGCLRVATSIGPDVILLDPRMPRHLERLLGEHPTSANAQILHLSQRTPRVGLRSARPGSPSPRVGSHAA